MVVAVTTMAVLLTLLFFLVGGIIGWLSNRHFFEIQPVMLHPEMFDKNGNILPDEIISVHFEGDLDDIGNEEEDWSS